MCATFNEAYLPARVGETQLTSSKPILDAGEDTGIGAINNSESKNSIESITTSESNNINIIKHASVGSSTMVNDDAKNNSDKKSKNRPDLQEQYKLLLDTDSIIRASSLIAKSAPHIHERCTKADGCSISEAYKITYSHESAPNEVWIYKRKDIKYDIQRSWISLESPHSGGKIDIELSNDDDDITINNSPGDGGSSGGSPPKTPLSIADTPRHAHNYPLRSLSAGNTPSTSNTGVNQLRI